MKIKRALFPITKNNHIEFFEDGDHYYEKYLSCIRSATTSIHLQTYIFEIDRIGTKVRDELILAAKRGVEVCVLVDSIGSRNLTPEAEQIFRDGGVKFCRFNGIQFKWLYRWGRRLHHKILLIDYKEAIVGGINVLYACIPGSTIPQLDFAVYLKGPETVDLAHYCQHIFKKASKSETPIKKITDYISVSHGYDVGISVNDWIHGRSKITKQYARMTFEAQESITIINSYFFPRKKFMKQLTEAAARGVRVRLILPRYSDWPSYIMASEYLYEYFLKRGVEIYLWNKSVLHGKLATIDQSWSTIGSFNLNYTSYQQNLEMNVDIYSKEFTMDLNKQIDDYIADGCVKIDPEIFKERYTFRVRLSRLFFYLILAIIANFSIGLSFQEDHNKEHRFYHILRIIGSIFFFILGLLGALLPIIPGFPFFVISFLLVYKQILLNRKTADQQM
ncbi:phospholipase D-like domain-containing protein [Bacteriovorax sp. PP10]|uniref:Phospholipase D-like domain-containing protein n=1 Tax=Bacteriovorax antarcticus TaxID=3088717 RepID=A0ABU5VWJ6_9BACT|nr:phospholipase D-like domain-containing protein [Bacteriovorax sp. PP10]MEA9357424.1 phospholipase D-like domain-containing protein [Bacteriovorax sp. PP10]